MKFNLLEKNEPIKEVIAFLNSPAIDFYKNRHQFSSPTYAMHIKSILLAMMNVVERTIRGSFDCDLYLKNVNAAKMREMFPAGCQILEIEDGKFYVGSRILNWLRNINAHAYISKEDEQWFRNKIYKYRLDRMPKFYSPIKYALPNETITMGGVISLIMLFLREKNIEMNSKLTNLVSMISCGSTVETDGVAFVQRISRVNLEKTIRITTGNDLYASIVGEYSPLDKNGRIMVGLDKNPTFDAKFQIFDHQIVIKRGSTTKTFYKEDFVLDIKDKDSFITLSNRFPPFTFVDLLYKMNITVFDKGTYELIEASYDKKYGKLTYSKFYTDKNIDILLLDETIADQRLASIIINGSIDSIFLRLEKRIYDSNPNLIENLGDDYSKFGKALGSLGIKNVLECILLRNASLHGYILGEASIYQNFTYLYEITTIIDTLFDLMVSLKNKQDPIYINLRNDIHMVLVGHLIGLKYGKVLEYSLSAAKGFPPYAEEKTIQNRFLYVESSMYDFKLLNKLYIDNDIRPLIVKYIIEGEERPMYLRNNQVELDYLKKYLKNKDADYTQDEVIDDGLVKTIYLKKLSNIN